jgi:hypothetical protein
MEAKWGGRGRADERETTQMKINWLACGLLVVIWNKKIFGIPFWHLILKHNNSHPGL